MRNLGQKSGMKKVERRLIGEVFWRWTYRILFSQLENVQILLRRRQCVGWGQVRNSGANIKVCRLECIESRSEGKQAPCPPTLSREVSSAGYSWSHSGTIEFRRGSNSPIVILGTNGESECYTVWTWVPTTPRSPNQVSCSWLLTIMDVRLLV